MAEAEEAAAPAEQQLSCSGDPEDRQPAARAADTEERAAGGAEARCPLGAVTEETSLDKFKIKKFFVLRVKTFQMIPNVLEMSH